MTLINILDDFILFVSISVKSTTWSSISCNVLLCRLRINRLTVIAQFAKRFTRDGMVSYVLHMI